MATTTGRVIDLDDLLDEAAGKPVELKLKGKTFVLPAECPLSVGVYGAREDIDGVLVAVFGDQLPDFLALGFPLSKLEALIDKILETYGVSAGEASASSSSSGNGGRSSRRTSSASTD